MRSKPRGWLLLVALAAAVCVLAAAAYGEGAARAGEKRLALVIGNAAYPSALPTATDDAGLVAEALAQDGFAVTAVANADAATLRKAVTSFADRVRAAGGKPLIFVYMSGHGVQYAGANYVVPVDVSIERQSEIPTKAEPLSEILNTLEALPARARIFVYDLAHPNAIAKGEALPLAGGLRHMQPGPGSAYAFNAAPGMVGGTDVPFYGVYARALAEALRTPGLDLPGLFSRVRLRVAEITSGAVIPWDNEGPETEATLLAAGGRPPPAPIADQAMAGLPVQTVYWASLAEDTLAGYQAFLRAFPQDPLAARIKVLKAVRLEAATWAESCREDTASAYWTFMTRYPRGPHYVDVRRRLAAIHAALAPPMRFDASDLGGLPAPSADEVRLVERAGPTFVDPAWPALPPMPDELLPPPPATIYLELAPPPLAPVGALPIPAPLPGAAPRIAAGPIEQPFVGGIGPLTITAAATAGDGVEIRSSSPDGLIAQVTTKLDRGERTVAQTDAAEEVVSWTTVVASGGAVTITQTGPLGEVLSRETTRAGPEGDRATVLTNGSGKLVAEVKSDKRGTITAVTAGTARIADQSLYLTAVSPLVPPAPAPPKEPPPEPTFPSPGAAPEPGASSTKNSVAPADTGRPSAEPTKAPAASPRAMPQPEAATPAPPKPGPPPADLGLRGATAEPPQAKSATPSPDTHAPGRGPARTSMVPLAATPTTAPTPTTASTSTTVPGSAPRVGGLKAQDAPTPLPVPRPVTPSHKKRPLVFQRHGHHPSRR